MPIQITLPRLGWSMEEGKFLAWLKRDGDAVKEGEPIFTLESDKAAQEVEAMESGTLRIVPGGPKPGDVIKVGHLLGYLLGSDETMPDAAGVDASPPIKRVDLVRPGPSSASKARRSETPASPRARRAAKTHKVDFATVPPTGNGGRIRERDVLGAAIRPMPGKEVPITTMRRAIATRMVHSMNNTAPVTLTCRCDATHLVRLREQLKAAGSCAPPSYTDIIAKITAGALRTHPMLTARWDTDCLRMPGQIHIGIAVDTEAGLVVPVLREVDTASLTTVANQSRQLIESARAGRLSPGDMQGGCFTITNLGSFGIEAFTPVINYPETAILGLGAIIREPVALEDGTLTSRLQMTLSLTFDHRILDGAPAARFLQAVRGRIEEPIAWLM